MTDQADKRAIWNAAYGAAFAVEYHAILGPATTGATAWGGLSQRERAREFATTAANAAVASLPDDDTKEPRHDR